MSLEPWVTDEDLLLYCTRSLYLFWCADCLARYPVRLKRGSIMLREVRDVKIVKLREEATHIAKVLLKNWVAWTLFVESLPKGAFNVRLPVGHEV